MNPKTKSDGCMVLFNTFMQKNLLNFLTHTQNSELSDCTLSNIVSGRHRNIDYPSILQFVKNFIFLSPSKRLYK